MTRSRRFAPWVAAALAACQLELDAPASCPDLALLTWNLEWFQHPERGPDDEALQFEIAVDVLGRAGASLVALQEISEPSAFHELVDRLGDYAGVLTDHSWPQQLGLLFRRRELALLSSGVLRGLDDAGRAPLLVELEHESGARLWVVVVHAKAGSTPRDHAHRERFARGLLDALERRADPGVAIVMGDFNDHLRGSLVPEHSSPYEALAANGGLTTPTAALELGPEPSTIWGATVDHILVDASCFTTSPPALRSDVFRDELLAVTPDYAKAVSDHFPVRVLLSTARPRSSGAAPQTAPAHGQ